MLNPTITAFNSFVSKFALALIISVFFMFPMLAFKTGILSCSNKTNNASKLPSESALAMIPCFLILKL
jgi:hypothetical protein